MPYYSACQTPSAGGLSLFVFKRVEMVVKRAPVLLGHLSGRHAVFADLKYLSDKVDRVLDGVAVVESDDLIERLIEAFIALAVHRFDTLKKLFGPQKRGVVELAAFMDVFSDLDIILEAFSVDDMVSEYVDK